MEPTKDGKRSRLGSKGVLSAVAVLVLCVACGIAGYVAPVFVADASTDVEAGVTVSSEAVESYGAEVAEADRCVFAWFATGEPDGWSAALLHRGWIGIKLEETLTGCGEVAVWVAKAGWGSPRFDVYVSADGERWVRVGRGKCTSREPIMYRFSGDFGDVAYVGVKRYGPALALLLLDAVWADASEESE
ncbi:MAG: hypothetical protein SVP26_00225 [Chloroflexota bacterium]|nr:hypothetical protein [Chloroflexota bacterium]